jgi:geranylgeranyl diphosphate synthase, type II
MPHPVVSFEATCRELQARIDAALGDTLQRYRGGAAPDPWDFGKSQGSGCPDRLFEAMRYSLLAGGKRLRPKLVLLACEACGGSTDDALPAACAIEMVHTYSLIHDDLPAMDDDRLRRGRPTCHVQFDEATAILAGDALLTLAFELLAREIHPGELAAACCAELASAAGLGGMVGGQMADLQAEHGGVTSVQQLEAIHRRKTGRLLSAALGLGARIAGASSAFRTALETYGKCIGLAFQITDDLLDVVGDRVKMGKDVRKDSDHGKLTYPALLGADESRRKARELIEDARHGLGVFGERGATLEALAEFILERDH